MKHEILTDKLRLRHVEKSDVKNLHELRTNPEVSKFIKRDLNKSLSDIEKFIEERTDGDLYFVIITLEKNEFAGTITLWNIDYENKYAELGYELLPSFQNRGIMTNAVNGLLNYAFDELNFETIEAYTHKENYNSKRLLERFKFELVHGKIDEDNLNNVVYRLAKVNR